MKLLYNVKSLLSILILVFSCLLVYGQNTISGTVTDNDGEALIGVNIFLSGTDIGTVTDLDGKYSIEVPEEGGVLVFSYIGYSNVKMPIAANTKNAVQDVVMGTDGLALDEVVVTGTFTGRTQKEAPMSLTKLNPEQLSYLNNNSQADVLRVVPGITAEGGGGEVATNLFVRGFPSGGQYAFTPLQIDGIPILSTFGLNSSAHDVFFRNDIGIRDLEFVRGGASTLFGAGSVAGIVNYNSIRGSANFKNKIQLELAQGGRARVDMLTSGPLAKDLYYAVSALYRYDEGPLETGMPTRGYQVRGNIKKVFNEGNSSVTLLTQLIDDNVQFYLPYPLDDSDGNRERPTGNDGEEIFTMLSGQLRDYSFNTPFGIFKSPIGDGVTTDGGYVMLDLKHGFGDDWLLSSKAKAASYEHWFNLFLDGDGYLNTPETQASFIDSTGLPINGTRFFYADDGSELATDDLLFENRILDRQRDMDELVGEINLTKTTGIHNITVGTFMANTKALDNNWIHNVLGDFSNSPRAITVEYDEGPDTLTYATAGFIPDNFKAKVADPRQTANKTLSSSKIAFYAADEIKGDNWSVDVGIRWERASGNVSLENGVGSNKFNKAIVSANDVAIALAGLYKLNEDLNLYANFSRGYFFPQLRSLKFDNGAVQSYETENVIQGELGVKYGAGQLAGTAALFFNSLTDRRNVDIVNDGQGGITESIQLQDTRAFGIEASLNYNVTKGLDVFGNFTYQNHQFTKIEGDDQKFEGNSIGRIPNIMGMIGLNFENSGFDANLTSNILGSKFTNTSNSVELDGFNIMRLDAGYSFGLGQGNEKARIGIGVFNLLDAAGVTEGSPRQGNSQISGGSFFVGRPILPRRVFLKLGFDF